MNDFKLLITPRTAGLRAGVDNTVDVMVMIEAPDTPATATVRRAPLNLALVLDRSGSMRGTPLEEARRCATHIVSRLSPADRVAIVAYDDAATVIAPSQPVADHDAIRRAIASIDSRGCTNLHGGWLLGAEQASPHIRTGAISRVVLLSDGLANRGLQDRAAILDQCAALAAAGVSTSTYGLGLQFDEELMTGIARAGAGNSYYGQTAEDLMDPIQEELQLLSALVARQVHLNLRGHTGAAVEVMTARPSPAPGIVALPDLAYDSATAVLLQVQIGRAQLAGFTPGALVTVLEASADAVQVDGVPMHLVGQLLRLPILSDDDFAALPVDPQVEARRVELQVGRIQLQAREAVLRDDWGQVDHLLAEAQQVGAENAWITSTLEELRALAARREAAYLGKEMLYTTGKLHSRRSAKASRVDSIDLAQHSFLREKPIQGKRET